MPTARWVALVLGVTVSAIGGIRPSDSMAYLSGNSAEFSEDGRLVLVQTGGALAVWDLESRDLVGRVPDVRCDQLLLLKQEGWLLCATNAVTIYDWKHQAIVATIPPEGQDPMRILAYSHETDRMVVRQGDAAVSVWTIGEKLVPLKHIPVEVGKAPVSFAASPDTKMLAVAEGRTVHLYDLTGPKTRDISLREGTLQDLLFAPDGSTLAAGIGNMILLIDVPKGTVRGRVGLTKEEGARGRLVPRTFSLDGSRLVAGNGEWSYPMFDTGTGKRLTLTDFPYDDYERNRRSQAKLVVADITQDGDVLVGQPEYPASLRIWDLRAGMILPDLCSEDCLDVKSRVSLLKWSPDGSKILIEMQGSRDPALNGKIAVWDVPSRSPELVLDSRLPKATVLARRIGTSATKAASIAETAGMSAFVHDVRLRAVAGSPTSPLIATAGDDGLLKVWDPLNGLLLRRLKLQAPANALAFSSDGSILTAGTIQGEVRLWDTTTWQEYPPYRSQSHPVNALQILPGNRMLAVAGGQSTVFIVDLVTRRVVKELLHHGAGKIGNRTCDQAPCENTRDAQGDVVSSIATIEGSSMLMTASKARRVVWDIGSWSLIEKPQGFPDNWSPLGGSRPLLATSAGTSDPQAFALTIWDTKRNGPVATLDTFTRRDTQVTDNGKTVELGASLLVDPRHRLAATRIGEYVSVWDLAAKVKRAMFHVKRPAHLHWTSEGKHLVISTRDRKVLVWSAETMEPAYYLRDPSVMQ